MPPRTAVLRKRATEARKRPAAARHKVVTAQPKTDARATPKRRRGDTTRLRLLDAAERCFAEGGFDGVSLRTITETAGVDLALVNYHFGSKDNLLREVIARRAKIVHDDRVTALEMARHRAGTRPPSVEAIIAAFLKPMLRRLQGGEPGWRHYAYLISQLDVSPKFTALTSDVLDPTALHFINALRQALPDAKATSIYWGYMFLLGAMVQVLSETGRIERLSGGQCSSDDIDTALREIVPFVAGGLRAMAARTPSPTTGGRSA